MEDLLGLIIFLFFVFGGRILNAWTGKEQKKPSRRPQPGEFPGMPRWLEDLQRELAQEVTGREEAEPVHEPTPPKPALPKAMPVPQPKPKPVPKPVPAVPTPEPRQPELFGLDDLKRAIVMKEILGPPKARRLIIRGPQR